MVRKPVWCVAWEFADLRATPTPGSFLWLVSHHSQAHGVSSLMHSRTLGDSGRNWFTETLCFASHSPKSPQLTGAPRVCPSAAPGSPRPATSLAQRGRKLPFLSFLLDTLPARPEDPTNGSRSGTVAQPTRGRRHKGPSAGFPGVP